MSTVAKKRPGLPPLTGESARTVAWRSRNGHRGLCCATASAALSCLPAAGLPSARRVHPTSLASAWATATLAAVVTVRADDCA
jgi:transglutaminase-like putative cysteine protease